MGVPSWISLGFLRPGPQLDWGSSRRAFGTPGAGGSFGFADPDGRLGYAYVMNNMEFHMFDDPREKALRDAVHRSSGGSPAEANPLGAKTAMPKITPHLWFDTQARDAAELYSAVFPDSRVTSVTTLRDTPSGDCDVVSFTLWGHEFMAISAGPLFKINPSISFIVNFGPGRPMRREARWTGSGRSSPTAEPPADAARRVPVQQALRLGPGPLRRVVAADPLEPGAIRGRRSCPR